MHLKLAHGRVGANGDVVGRQRVSCGAMKGRDGLVQICLSLQFARTRGEQVGLSLQDQKDCRSARAKLTLLARVLLLG